MKNSNQKYLILLFAALLLFTSCSKDDEEPISTQTSEAEIEKFITPELLTAMKDMGFNVNPGFAPPVVEGTFLVSPFTKTGTTVPNDIASFFAPLTFTFFNQNKETNSIEYKGENGNETGKGMGSLIAGNGKKFTVFLKVESTHLAGDSAINIRAISGEISDDGIVNLQFAAFMLDNHGNPNANWIPNKTGRLFEDGDGLAERQ